MATMGANEKTASNQSNIPDSVKLRRAERDRRIAEIYAHQYEIEVEPPTGLKELVDSQDAYRERIMSLVRRIAGS